MFRILASIIFLGALSSCATFSREECERMDWTLQGRQTALNGKTLDQAAFKTGFDSGLKTFCTSEFSYRFALKGGEYQGTCPQVVEAKLTEKYKSGRLLYLEKRVEELTAENQGLDSEVTRLRMQSCPSCDPAPICPSPICPICSP